MRSMLRHVGLTFLIASGTFAEFIPSAEAADERRVLGAKELGKDEEDTTSEYALLAQKKRLESIKFLKELLGKGAEGDQKAEMLLRLADLYFQEGRYVYLSEMAAYDKKYDECMNTPEPPGCDETKLKVDNTNSREYQSQAIKLYEQILANYQRYSRADEASFYLGTALNEVGRTEDAVERFTNLVKQYPESSYVPDAYVAIGEYYFTENNAFKALVAYSKATGYPDSPMYGFACYKLAWCYYNVGEYDKAIDTMKKVVALEASADKKKLQLQEEALKDMVRFFADADKLDEAYEYFNKIGKKELIRPTLQRLARTFYDQGKFERSIEAYQRLVADNPSAPENPVYQVEIIEAYKKIGRQADTFAEVDRLLKNYGKESAWRRTNASNPDAVKDADEKIEVQLRKVATEYHESARKLRTGDAAKEAYTLAYKAYSTYLVEFPEGKNTYNMRYEFGELLYKLQRYEEAFDQYVAVVKMDPKGEHSRLCAESAIFAADEMIKKEAKSSSTPDPGASKEPQPLTGWEQRLVDSCKLYADLYPDDKKVKNVIYKSAYLLYNKHRFAEAAEQFNAVIKMDPGSKEAEQAAHLILDSFKINEDIPNLRSNAKFYYDQQGLGGKQFKAEVYEIYERASFKLIEETLVKDSDKSKAADSFVAFYQEFPKSPVAAQALNNATVYYNATARITDEMKIRHILVDDPEFGTKTKYYYDQISALGYNYETIADFDKAAYYYEKLFTLYPKQLETVKKDAPDKEADLTKNVADALYSAALFRRALGSADVAIADYKQFASTFPADPRTNDVKLTIGKIWEDEKKWSEAGNVYYGFYSKPAADTPAEYLYFARLRYGKALEAQSQKSKADEVYKDSVALYKKQIAAGGQPGAHTAYVAEMMYILAQPKLEKYLALKIKGSGTTSKKAEDKAFVDSLKAKTQSMVEMEKTYSEIITTGAGEWGLASLVRLGEVYENMGKTMKDAPLPFYLDDDQKEMYVMQIEDRVYPQVEKAVAAYNAALGKSYELTLYNDNTAVAARRLGELRPDDFPGLFEELLPPRYTSSTNHVYNFETEL